MFYLEQAEQLLAARRPAEAVALLCQTGVPANAEVCALLARAYYLKGDAKGDVFAARFFARRAVHFGATSKTVADILAATEPPASTDAVVNFRPPQSTLGGVFDKRPDTPAPYPFYALSRLHGQAQAAKDFDWLAKNIPCQAACPAKTNIPEYLTAIFTGDADKAYAINVRDNVFPGVLGRVCSRPCEADCRHGWAGLGESVAICWSKRAAADLREPKLTILPRVFADSGATVAVVGAGVAGLTVARELALWGHRVTVYEKHRTPGGMMNQGIPEFRLPREVIAREIDQISALGVDLRCGVAVGAGVSLHELLADNDAVVLAAGTLRPNCPDLPGKELAGIRHGLDFLLEVNETGAAEIGRNVAVIGGGFTAMDCARTAKRLAAASAAEPAVVRVWYRRSVNEMLVTPGELEELEEEGIPMEFMVSPQAYLGVNGRVTHMRFVRTELGEEDAGGRRRPVEIPGSEFDVPADTVLPATGQFPDCSWIDEDLRGSLVGEDGWLKSGAEFRAAHPKIFVAGDFAQGAKSLIEAIGHAKNAARAVDFFLTGKTRVVDRVTIADVGASGRIREMDAVALQPMPCIDLARRNLAAEVETGYDQFQAVDETQRCYRCHLKYEIDPDRCIYCDWCIKAKPRAHCILRVKSLDYDDDGRIVGWNEAKRSQEATLIWINQEDCIRCGACLDACPVDAISLQKVDFEIGVPCRRFR